MARILALFFVLPFLLLAGCGKSDSPPPRTETSAEFPLSLPSADGQTLTLKEAPRRIVSLDAATTEILCELGAADQLVAVERFENCPRGASSRPALDAFQPNLEAIAAYRPDLVIVTYNPSGLVESLRRVNIPVLYLDLPKNLAGVYDAIERLGAVTDRADAASRLIVSLRREQEAITSRVSNLNGPRVYHELDDTYYSAAPQSFVGDFYRLLRAGNIAEGATSDYPQLSAEVIIQRNPQVIVLADEAAGVTPAAVKQRPGWGVIDAVRNDRICSIDPDILSRPGPRVVEALRLLAKCLYPDRF